LHGTEPREPYLARASRGFEVWADERVPNESESSSPAGALRRLIAGEIRRLGAASDEEVLHAAFAGARWRGTDVENLLFNNIDQTLALFRSVGRVGVRFEDLGERAPPVRGNSDRTVYYAYRLADRRADFTAVACDRLVCGVSEIFVPEGPARMAARVWLAVRRGREQLRATTGSTHLYTLRIKAHGLEPATTVKALVDGASAAMQRALDTDELRACVSRLAALLAASENELFALAAGGPEAPLGDAKRLFRLDGDTQVRVTPDDDRCIAAEVVAVSDERPAHLVVELHAARRRELVQR
jgi:hypothetical protein